MRLRTMSAIACVATTLLIAGPVFEAQASPPPALQPWIFPIQRQEVSSCQALDSEPKLSSWLIKHGVKLAPHKTLNINWAAGNIALVILTVGGDQPKGLEYGGLYDPNRDQLVIESAPSTDPNPRLFVFEWSMKMHKWKVGKCRYLSVEKTKYSRACLSSGAVDCFAE
jgi:hypothetical protein